MNSCYAVRKFMPNTDGTISTSLEALTENLYLAERVISNYYRESFGEDGGYLVCESAYEWGTRKYWMRDNYRKNGATYFEVYEEEIKDDAALL